MTIEDRIYGRIEVEDRVIADLIMSKPFQRLKGISQDGAPHFIQPVRNVTRYEHSIGVWYLSKIYHRPIEEQIACLLHDLPHTAFSHVIDFVMDDEQHEFHEKFTDEVIRNSEIPDILVKHSVNIEKVLNKENYDLLENSLPDVSVDRWDYFMRDGYMFGVLPKQTIELFLKSVKEKDNSFYFEDRRIAVQFAVLFMNCSRLIWLDPTSHGTFYLISQAIKIGLEKELITQDDFFLTDNQVMAKLRQTNVFEIDGLLNRLEPGKNFVYAPQDQAEFYGPNKPRFVDPWVMEGDELKRVSELVPGMRDYFAEFVARYKLIGVRQEGQ